MSKESKARLMLIASMTVFGTIGIFVRNVAISSGEIALCRAVLAIALIGVFLVLTKQKISFVKIKKELPLLLISGAAMGINWILLFEAYKYTTVSVATLSYYFAPVLVIAICPIIFHERLTPKQTICFVMSTLGIIMITGIGDFSRNTNNLTGIFLGLGAAVFYATVIILNKFIKNIDGIQRTFLQFAASVIVLLPYVMLTGGFDLSSLDGNGIINLLIIGTVHTGVTYCLYFSSLKELSGQKAAILSYIDPLVAILVSVAVLNEQITSWQIAGGILILGFTLLNEISTKAK